MGSNAFVWKKSEIMKMIKISPWIVCFSISVLVFTIGLVALGTFYSSFFHDRSNELSEELQFIIRIPSKGAGDPPIFAYWISGTLGESEKIMRLLKAVYHPRNRYLLQLDAGASEHERSKLALSVQSEMVFRAFGNVDVVGQAYGVDHMGSSAVAATLHAAAILLKIGADWDWFITLSASDYPLVTQDDLLHAFRSLPRDLNFIYHTSNTSLKEYHEISQIVIDPNLHFSENSKIFSVNEMREIPDDFKIFTGSPWVILSRPFTEYCVHGWENLPRKLLMYFTNVAYPLKSYFQTVICNSPQFKNTIVNSDLRYSDLSSPLHLGPHFLSLSHYKGMVKGGSAFAGQFKEGDPVLLKVDDYILRRHSVGVVPGKWCSGPGVNKTEDDVKQEYCSSWANIDAVAPGPYGEKLKRIVSELVNERRQLGQCDLLSDT